MRALSLRAFRPLTAAAVIAAGALTSACGGGVPVRIAIDEFTFDLSLDDTVAGALGELQSSGVLPPGTQGLPELWPPSMPAIRYDTLLNTPPVPVDLTPEPGTPEADKYEAINQAEQAVKRIEINRLILRIDASTLTVATPELFIQVADEPDADPADRLAWRTIGKLPSAPPGFVGDIDFTFDPGGETYLNAQLADDLKQFALRAQGRVSIDTEVNPRLPSGKAVLRLIVIATFFVDPEGAIGAAQNLNNGGGNTNGGGGSGGAGGT